MAEQDASFETDRADSDDLLEGLVVQAELESQCRSDVSPHPNPLLTCWISKVHHGRKMTNISAAEDYWHTAVAADASKFDKAVSGFLGSTSSSVDFVSGIKLEGCWRTQRRTATGPSSGTRGAALERSVAHTSPTKVRILTFLTCCTCE